jgi:hypothetical protein
MPPSTGEQAPLGKSGNETACDRHSETGASQGKSHLPGAQGCAVEPILGPE